MKNIYRRKMAILAVFLMSGFLTAATPVQQLCAQSNVKAFNACMANCHAISCKGQGSGSCKNKKLSCFASCQKLIKPVNGNKSRKYRR